MVNALVVELKPGEWLLVVRRYLLFVAGANLLWEILHLPLYTIWSEASFSELTFAVVHCTGGDLMIAVTTLILALLLFGDRSWPYTRFSRVVSATIALGVLYTVFSEWLNIVVRKSWAYSDWMPLLPIIGTGLSPLTQWIVIPAVAFWWARRPTAMLNGDRAEQKYTNMTEVGRDFRNR